MSRGERQFGTGEKDRWEGVVGGGGKGSGSHRKLIVHHFCFLLFLLPNVGNVLSFSICLSVCLSVSASGVYSIAQTNKSFYYFPSGHDSHIGTGALQKDNRDSCLCVFPPHFTLAIFQTSKPLEKLFLCTVRTHCTRTAGKWNLGKYKTRSSFLCTVHTHTH